MTKKFDPEGSGYDYESAKKHGLSADESGHWPSRVPSTGLILKGKQHPTFGLSVAEDKKLGYSLAKVRGRYHSFGPRKRIRRKTLSAGRKMSR